MSMKTKEHVEMSRSADPRFWGPPFFLCHRHEPQTPTAGVCATKTKTRSLNVYENKRTCQNVVARTPGSGVPRFFPCHRHEPQSPTAGVCATKTKARSLNVYENKRACQNVAQRRPPVLGSPRFFSCHPTRTADPNSGGPRYKTAGTNRRSEPGISMKTKDRSGSAGSGC